MTHSIYLFYIFSDFHGPGTIPMAFDYNAAIGGFENNTKDT